MGEHGNWFEYLPGYSNVETYLSHYLKRETMFTGFERTHFTIAHVAIGVFVTLLLVLLALVYAAQVRKAGSGRVIPAKRFGVRAFVELVAGATLAMATPVMGRRAAERFLPLIGTFVFFILFSNLIGLVPGFLPPTDTLKTNFALSGMVLIITQLSGFAAHGWAHLKHFTGPIWWMAPLMFPIEFFSHFFIRPGSLALRLMGNMFADHKLLGTITLLVPLLAPLPFYILGLLVCVVQTLVFSLLAMIYIGEAVAETAH